MPRTVSDYTALLSGTSWWDGSTSRKPVFVTYSFEAKPYDYLSDLGYSGAYGRSFKPFTPAEKAAARDALKQWDDASGITFLEAPAGQGDIRFANYDFRLNADSADAAAYAYYPATQIGSAYATSLGYGGDVFVDTGSMGYASDDMTHVLAHEIGHAIGLKHPFEGDTVLDKAHDSTDYTVMSYTGYAPKLGSFDKQAVQALYGTDGSDGRQVAKWAWDARTATLTQTGGGGADTIRGVASRDVMNGMGGKDTLFGSGGDDRISGGTGDDILFGGDGNDALSGGAGNDKLHGGSGYLGADDGSDTADYGAAKKTVTVKLNPWHQELNGRMVACNAQGVEIGRDSFSSIENVTGGSGADTITGDAKANTLKGGAGRDHLDGGAGSDVLFGGLGGDTLTGGAGADRFVFDAKYGGANLKTVTDFAPGSDKLVFDQDLFHGLTRLGKLNAIEFRAGSTAQDATDHLIYNKQTGALSYDADGRGGHGQVKIAELDAGLTLHASDFLIIA